MTKRILGFTLGLLLLLSQGVFAEHWISFGDVISVDSDSFATRQEGSFIILSVNSRIYSKGKLHMDGLDEFKLRYLETKESLKQEGFRVRSLIVYNPDGSVKESKEYPKSTPWEQAPGNSPSPIVRYWYSNHFKPKESAQVKGRFSGEPIANVKEGGTFVAGEFIRRDIDPYGAPKGGLYDGTSTNTGRLPTGSSPSTTPTKEPTAPSQSNKLIGIFVSFFLSLIIIFGLAKSHNR